MELCRHSPYAFVVCTGSVLLLCSLLSDVHCDSDAAVCGQKLAALSSSELNLVTTTLHVEQAESAAFVATFVCISCAELNGVMPCSLVDKYQCYRGYCWLQLEVRQRMQRAVPPARPQA